MNDRELITQAQALIRAESDVLAALADQLDESFVQAVHLVSQCTGHILVTGAGTSGAMAHRMAHLLATCGIRAFYMTPGDALHGEAAITGPNDVLIALSKAGKSAEINQFASIAKQRGGKVIALTARADSELAKMSDVVALIKTDDAAEGEGILPFGNTLAHGAFGDALVLMAKRLRGFDLAQMTQTHPSGGAADLVREQQAAKKTGAQ
jgi:D-arabinose 5-phosphate isomerase GutQ